MKIANCSKEVDCLVVPTVQLVSLEVDYVVYDLVQLTQEGNQIPLSTSLILSAVVLVGLVRLLLTLKFQLVDLVE